MDKPKRKNAQLPSLTLVVLWAIIQSLGWAIIYMMLQNMSVSTSDIGILCFIGILAGGVIGALQHTLVDRGTGIDLKHWIVLTALGTAIGLMSINLFPYAYRVSPVVYIMPIFVVPAIFQWWSVRKVTRVGALWIITHVIATIVFVMFVEILTDQGFEFLSAVIPAGLQGIASGFVMVWLLRGLPKQDLTLQKQKIS